MELTRVAAQWVYQGQTKSCSPLETPGTWPITSMIIDQWLRWWMCQIGDQSPAWSVFSIKMLRWVPVQEGDGEVSNIWFSVWTVYSCLWAEGRRGYLDCPRKSNRGHNWLCQLCLNPSLPNTFQHPSLPKGGFIEPPLLSPLFTNRSRWNFHTMSCMI